MHLTPTAIAAVLGFATLGSTHMLMATPVPMGKGVIDNSPLFADGSNFPCKIGLANVYDVTTVNNMPLGSTQPLSFIGSAVHGGGSCQISITYDANPTKSSVFKVIHSIMGGCPMKNIAGNNGDSADTIDPSTYSFTIPDDLPTGNATLAWTWFNKVGNREMYMNCAAISLTGSTTKRQELVERDQAAFNALPDMFVANVGNGCATRDAMDVRFPDPGDSVEFLGQQTSSALQPAIGACGATATGATAVVPTGSASAATLAASTITSAASVATSAASPSTTPSATGGVFITVATTAAASTAAPVASSAPIASAAPSVATSAEASPVVSSATSVSTGTPSSGNAFTAGTACTTEGQWNCVGGTQFQQCASGQWSVLMAVAAGTTCASGEGTNIDIVASPAKKRDIRFSGQHLRRHLLGN